MSTTHRAKCIAFLVIPFVLPQAGVAADDRGAASRPMLDEITIVGDETDAARTVGGVTVIDTEDLERFRHADVQRIVREIPGVSVQTEDGYGLRPNLSIRGTASERSSRITLLEDNVLIAPAPYSAPSAYYFPTAGRMNGVEVLKGPAAVRQGPYTVGGAINLLSTPIPDQGLAGLLNVEAGEDSTGRLHGFVGESTERFGWLVEGHLWNSDGYQRIRDSDADTGLDKDDWMAKLRWNSAPGSDVYQQFDLKLQYATERSEQSYLGLTDGDFARDPWSRYAVSQLDNIDTEHKQLIVRYGIEFAGNLSISATAYENRHERNWFKTEGYDADGSASVADFDGSSWLSVINAINAGEALNATSAVDL